MKSFRYLCYVSAVVSTLVLAQTVRTPVVEPPNEHSIARQHSHSPKPSTLREAARFVEQGGNSLKPTTLSRGTSPQSGLNFAPAVSYSSGGYFTISIAVADVNGDGKPDLAVASLTSNNVGVLLGNGDGTFQTAVTYDSGGNYAHAVAIADVNGDGKPDLLVANDCDDSNTCNSGVVGVLLGNGDGTFQAPVAYPSGGANGYSVAVADVNHDGKPDLVVANCAASGDFCSNGGTVGVLLGNGDGTFQTAVPYGSGGLSGVSVAVADVNSDGNPDLVVANLGSNNVGVLLGNGDGTFQTAVTYDSGGSAYAVAIADVNADGKPDLLVANCGSTDCGAGASVAVLLGNGDGTFQAAANYSTGGGEAYSVSVADVNSDGKPDLVTANGNGNTVGVLLGNGDGTFQPTVAFGSGGSDAWSVAAVDVNGDGKPDLIAANSTGGLGVVGVLINTSLNSTSTVLSSSNNPSNFGQAVTFTALVTSSFSGTPTGTVNFFNGGTNIGNSNLNSSGIATLTISTLAVGTHTITATYNGDSNFASSTSSPLYQVVQGAIATLSPTGLNFGNQTVDIASSPQMVTLQNTGNINLAIAAIQITGQNAGDFMQKNNCPASLPPNTSCQVNVTFKPTAAGSRSAAVSVSDNAPGSPQSASLTGVGVLPTVMFSPTNLTFPITVVFTTSAPQKVTLTNTGPGILEIMSAKISPQFGVTTNCGETLAPGASCTAEVSFKPTTKGQIGGSISISDNAPGSPQEVPLSGTGTFVELTPSSLNFGNQPVNSTSVPKVITVVNKGNGVVNFTGMGIMIVGADPGDFAQTNDCGASLASGAHCYIKVTFTPLQQGKRTAGVSVSDDGGGSPQLVPLAGTGTP